MDEQSVRQKRSNSNFLLDQKTQGSGGNGTGGNTAGPGENGGGTIGDLDDLLTNGKAEIRHLIDPFDGTYKTKLTIPKNFTGYLYLSGLNISSLTDRIVYVRFSFGRELEAITLQGTIGRAPGIIPQTDIEVIILDIRGKPFEKIRLLYDLYDYTDYRDDSGVEFGSPDTQLTTNPRNRNLYCRGLRLEHDSTFVPSLNRPLCNYPGAQCLYTYAKIKDTGLYDSSDIAKIVSEPQIDLRGLGYDSDHLASQLKKCLPDNDSRDNLRDVLALTDAAFSGSGYGVSITMPDSSLFTYRGPYRAISPATWGISQDAIWSKIDVATGPTGLFQSSWGNVTGDLYQDYVGYQSFIFPRSGKMSLSAGVEHFSSPAPFSATSLTSLVSSGNSQYMDGCNIRVSNYDSYINEGISSCNVTGTIEIMTIDNETGAETVLAQNINLKLSLIRASNTDYQGNEVLYSSMKTCSNSQACGANECCYNNRCWDKSLVTRCLEDVDATGNGGTGAVCSSDFECSSLCCNASTGRCAVHVNNDSQQVLCSKSPGQSCVSKEWCRRDYVTNCFKVKTGTSSTGQQLCEIRCYQIPTLGECVKGKCVPPVAPSIPTINPNANNPCEGAVDPPTSFD
jgi:hypothetical protein